MAGGAQPVLPYISLLGNGRGFPSPLQKHGTGTKCLSHPTCKANRIKEQTSLSLSLHLNPDSGSQLGHVVGLSEHHFLIFLENEEHITDVTGFGEESVG